jgi:hypothetical protein
MKYIKQYESYKDMLEIDLYNLFEYAVTIENMFNILKKLKYNSSSCTLFTDNYGGMIVGNPEIKIEDDYIIFSKNGFIYEFDAEDLTNKQENGDLHMVFKSVVIGDEILLILDDTKKYNL